MNNDHVMMGCLCEFDHKSNSVNPYLIRIGVRIYLLAQRDFYRIKNRFLKNQIITINTLNLMVFDDLHSIASPFGPCRVEIVGCYLAGHELRVIILEF